ncbi:MAG: hypothetical protein ACR2G3_10150 [Solirubrobacterales bacterium]
MRGLATAITAVVLGLLFAACGEKSEPDLVTPAGDTQASTTTTARDGGSGDGRQTDQDDAKLGPQGEVETSIIAVLGGGDPNSACVELVTARYVRAAYGDERGCKAAVAKQGSFDVAVSRVRLEKATATATAEPAAGPNRGEAIEVELVDEGGAWKVDKALSNAPPGP